jgi:hypothetical protein
MNQIIKNIKQQYFTSQNINFICEILHNKYNIEINKDKLFKIQNSTFNNFLDKMYDKEINVQHLDKILVELNKLTIQLYLTPLIIQNQTTNSEIEIIPSILTYEGIQTDIHSSQTDIHSSQTDIHSSQTDMQTDIQTDINSNINSNINSDILSDIKNLIKELVNNINNNNNNTNNNNNNIIKEIIEIKDIIKLINENNQENKNNKSYLDLYSNATKYNDKGLYNFTFNIPLQNFIVEHFKIYSNDIFNNINEHNNKIQLVENNSKIKIIIPQGNYSIQELVYIIEKLINEKSVFKLYKIVYDKNKNRVQISNEKIFNITFIENGYGVQLKDILGYSKNEYNSNSNYSSENEQNNNVFKEIYVKSDNDNMNIFYTNLRNSDSDNDKNNKDNDNSLFKYFYRINDKISFNLKEPIYNMNLELYYKLNNRIIKFVKKIDFNILLKQI